MNAKTVKPGLALTDCVAPLAGKLLGDDENVYVRSVSTDTRTLEAGDTFIALAGPNHDAHEHCSRAEEEGAVALIVERKVESDLPQLVVGDCRLALGKLARLWVSQFQVPIIAVTGSNGKTTVKEMINAILSQLGPVLATEGNLNNEIGLPLTLLKLQPEHQYAVVEMGANHVGEIGYLSNLAKPDVAVITNISSAHLEGFGSVDAIATAKSEIFQGVGSDGHAVIYQEDKYYKKMCDAASHCQVVPFGMESGVEVRGGFINGQYTIKLRNNTIQPELQLLGDHNRLNAVAAAAAAVCVDIQSDTICKGLESMHAVPGRLQKKTTKAGAVIIDDTYNANPASVKAAIKVLSEQKGTLVLVIGDMRELGEKEVELHEDIGNLARESGIHSLYAVGSLAAHAARTFGPGGFSFDEKQSLIDSLAELHPRSTTFMVKGSRGARMEEIVSGLMTMRGNGAASGTPAGAPLGATRGAHSS